MQAQTEAITEEDLRLIQERESAIRQLEVQIKTKLRAEFQWATISHAKHLSFLSLQSDITDINDIFKDLGMMVHEQGDMIGESAHFPSVATPKNRHRLSVAHNSNARNRSSLLILRKVHGSAQRALNQFSQNSL